MQLAPEEEAHHILTETCKYVRVGFKSVQEGKLYGSRGTAKVIEYWHEDNLSGYSLVIPSFLEEAPAWALNKKGKKVEDFQAVKEHARYFGLLDMDMDLDTVMVGSEVLFVKQL